MLIFLGIFPKHWEFHEYHMCNVMISSCGSQENSTIPLETLARRRMAVDIDGEGNDCFRYNVEPLPAALQSSATALTVTVLSSGCHSLLTCEQPYFSDGQPLLSLCCFPLWIVRNILLLLNPALSDEDYRAEWFNLPQLSFSEDTSTLVGLRKGACRWAQPPPSGSVWQAF